jgi:hypothetical protein
VISLSIPYDGIWFQTPEVGSLVTTLDVEVDLRDAAGVSRWAHREAFGVALREESLEREPDGAFLREIPFSLDTAGEVLRGEDLKFEVRLRNRTGGEEARRTLGFPKRDS